MRRTHKGGKSEFHRLKNEVKYGFVHQIEELQTAFQQSQDELKFLRSEFEIEEIYDRLDDYEQELRCYRQQNSQLRKQVELDELIQQKAAKVDKQLRQQIRVLTDQVTKLQQEKRTWETTSSRGAAKSSGYQRTADDYATLAALQEQMNQMQTAYFAVLEEKQQLDARFTDLAAELQVSKSRGEFAVKQLDYANARVENLLQQVKQVSASLEAASFELKEEKQRSQLLANEVQRVNALAETAAAQQQQAKDHEQQLQAALKAAQDKAASLATQGRPATASQPDQQGVQSKSPQDCLLELDFTKYEEIITYIQFMTTELKEEILESRKSTETEKNKDFQTISLLQDKIADDDGSKLFIFDESMLLDDVKVVCQQALEAALIGISAKLSQLARLIIDNNSSTYNKLLTSMQLAHENQKKIISSNPMLGFSPDTFNGILDAMNKQIEFYRDRLTHLGDMKAQASVPRKKAHSC